MSQLCANFNGEVVFEGLAEAVVEVLYLGVGSSALAYTLQVMAQKKVEPAVTAIILSLEAVFAAIFGWLLLDENLNRRMLMGCLLMLTGILMSQAPVLKKWKSKIPTN